MRTMRLDAGCALFDPTLTSLSNNTIEAWRNQALPGFFIDKTHPIYAKTSNGTNRVGELFLAGRVG